MKKRRIELHCPVSEEDIPYLEAADSLRAEILGWDAARGELVIAVGEELKQGA